MNGQILAELRDSILHVSIERPEKRNALDEAMFSALANKLSLLAFANCALESATEFASGLTPTSR